MENNIFSFIVYSQNNQIYNECISYIKDLNIPKGYDIEIIRVNEGKSIASAYNYGMKKSKGKYKIYMDEDVFILNKDILTNSLNIFSSDDEIATIGIVGSKDLVQNGVWWESKERYGKVIESSTGTMKPLHFMEVNSDYEEVSLIDEMFMVTKDDICFREDILQGKFFHTSMYCVDIKLLGKKIVVPKQEEYWVMHNCGIVNLDGYDNDKNIFIKNYSDKIKNLYTPYKDITISLCMIVKNEEKILPRCINSIKSAMDEIIIVDTGSTDNTINIAKDLGCIVYNYDWIDDFGDARNFAFSKASKEYIIWLDADDIVTEENLNKIINIKKKFNTEIDSINMRYVLTEDENGNEGFVLKRNRIVKRSNDFKWIGSIHEYLNVYGNIYYSDISIHHKKDKEHTDRNLKIYNKMIEKGMELSVRDMLYYANELYYNCKFTEAIDAYHKFLDTKEGWVEDVKTALFNLAKSYEIRGHHEKQLETLIDSFKYDVPRADFCCEIGSYFLIKKDYNKAIFWYKEAIKCDNKESVAILDHATYTWIPSLQLCVCYANIEDYKNANYYNEKAGQYIPNDKRIHQNREYLKSKL